MKAIVGTEYGGPEVLSLEDVATPELTPSGVLVAVRAASVNPLDWHVLRGSPYLVRIGGGLRHPKHQAIPGVDVAGVVEAVGDEVSTLAVGDEVFGSCSGALAEHAAANPARLARKPSALTFEEAAAIPCAGVTALQALRDKGRLTSGQRVLVIGAGGGVGTFAVQVARALGAEVTGVCSTRNLELVRSIGAHDVVDYTTTDVTRAATRYDLVVDCVCNRSIRALRRTLTARGTLVVVGGGTGNWVGPHLPLLRAKVASPFVSQRLVSMLARITAEDLGYLADLAVSGALHPVVSAVRPLADAPDAIREVEGGHTRGKLVLTT